MESKHILNLGYMRSCAAPEGKDELLRSESEAGRVEEVAFGRMMFQVAKSHLDGNMWDGSRAEGTCEGALHQQWRRQAQRWAQEGEDTFHDVNLCVHRQL